MKHPLAEFDALWPLLVFFAAALILVIIMIGLSALLGQRHQDKATGDAYECGIVPTGSARIRFNVEFYLMAMFFVIFDLEAVFVYVWAGSARQLGWTGYGEILFFVGFLLLALFYLWRVGALSWWPLRRGETPRKSPY